MQMIKEMTNLRLLLLICFGLFRRLFVLKISYSNSLLLICFDMALHLIAFKMAYSGSLFLIPRFSPQKYRNPDSPFINSSNNFLEYTSFDTLEINTPTQTVSIPLQKAFLFEP